VLGEPLRVFRFSDRVDTDTVNCFIFAEIKFDPLGGSSWLCLTIPTLVVAGIVEEKLAIRSLPACQSGTLCSAAVRHNAAGRSA
jgi:hypothetical protein